MKIDDVLQRKPDHTVASVSSTDGIRAALDVLATHNIGALVVRAAGGGIEGILSERDIVRRLHDRGASVLDASVGEIMTTLVATCSPDDDVDGAMRVMTDRHIRHLPVVDHGTLIGIVSIGDVVKNRIDELEITTEQLTSYINS